MRWTKYYETRIKCYESSSLPHQSGRICHLNGKCLHSPSHPYRMSWVELFHFCFAWILINNFPAALWVTEGQRQTEGSWATRLLHREASVLQGRARWMEPWDRDYQPALFSHFSGWWQLLDTITSWFHPWQERKYVGVPGELIRKSKQGWTLRTFHVPPWWWWKNKGSIVRRWMRTVNS